MSYDSSDSIRITSDHLLTDDGNTTSKSGPQIFPWKRIQQKHSQQKIAKVWKALPRKLGVSWSSEGQLLPMGQRRQGGSSEWQGRTSQPGPVPPSQKQGRPGGSWASDTSMGMGTAWGQPAGGGQDPNQGRGSESAPAWDVHARRWGWSDLLLMPDSQEAMWILRCVAMATQVLRNKNATTGNF